MSWEWALGGVVRLRRAAAVWTVGHLSKVPARIWREASRKGRASREAPGRKSSHLNVCYKTAAPWQTALLKPSILAEQGHDLVTTTTVTCIRPQPQVHETLGSLRCSFS